MKSPLLSFILVFLFGPLGLLYTSIQNTLLMILYSLISLGVILLGVQEEKLHLIIIGIVILILIWPISLYLSISGAEKINKEREKEKIIYLKK